MEPTKKVSKKVKLTFLDRNGAIESKSREPLVLSFPGQAPPAAENLAYSLLSQKFDPLKPNKRLKRKIIGGNERVTYEGNNLTEGSNLSRYLVGVYDESEKTVTFQDVGHIFVMRTLSTRVLENSALDKEEGLSNADRKKLLIESFGTRKKQRVVHAQQANIVKAENVAGAAGLSGIVEKFVSPTKTGSTPLSARQVVSAAQDAMEEQRQLLLPPYNVDATRPQDVYDIKAIIPDNLLESVSTHLGDEAFEGSVSEFIEIAKRKLDYIPTFVLGAFERLSSLDTKGKEKVQKLLFLRHMFAFYRHKDRKDRKFIRRIQDHAEEMQIPNVVLSYLFDKFAERQVTNKLTTFRLSKQGEVKLRLHMLVVCLVMQKFQLELNSLTTDFETTPEKLSESARELGCTVKIHQKASSWGKQSKKIKIHEALLTMPFSFPRAFTGRVKAKNR